MEGFGDAIKSLKAVKASLQPRILRSALNAALTPGLKSVRSAAPVGSEPHKTYKGRTVVPGFMKRSARKSTKISRDRKRVFGKISIDGEAFYGKFIEYGTKNLNADPFFYEAIAKVEDEMTDAFFKKIEERIDKLL